MMSYRPYPRNAFLTPLIFLVLCRTSSASRGVVLIRMQVLSGKSHLDLREGLSEYYPAEPHRLGDGPRELLAVRRFHVCDYVVSTQDRESPLNLGNLPE